ncbi:MAG: BMP family ABC transporter substrate-binding protein [Eubacterium sp.]|jgi:basic membrane lipoprotein Med (substrate-binding protein (PBP1-ABC) superfamily)|nr:BMP family ABC transporter substrate-binding protein [Eubacterium sp.]
MLLEAYQSANKRAQKAYRAAMNKGEYPYLSALDDFLPYERTAGEKYIGIVEIPLDLVAGTKTAGRQNSFANNFMPLLGEDTEFAYKWSGLYESQLEEGIRDPIVAYEYMHRFYVMEGNKRVSVLKSLNAAKISAKVTRIIPKKTDDLENRIYYEFMDFFDCAKIYDIWFSKEGSYAKLTKSYGYEPGQTWSEESQKALRSEFLSFRKIYKAKGGDKVNITSGDAFLAYIELFPAWQLQSGSEDEIKSNLTKMWDEFLTLGQGQSMKIVLEPHQKEKTTAGMSILNRILSDAPKQQKIAFIFEKSVVNSAWNYAHEMGRMHVEHVFGEKIKTSIYEHAEFTNNSEDIIEAAIEDGNQIIFTVPAQLANASVKAALKHPEVKILNCSTNSKYQAIRTYYCRMYESKFLLGVIAGALSETNDIGYMADYPIYSTIANINAFALGAQMVNPRVRVHLRWGSVKKDSQAEWPDQVRLIFDKDMINPKYPTRKYGLYRQLADGQIENIATSICHWGKVYELIIRSIIEKTWNEEAGKNKNQALNYWWGLSSGVLEIVYSQKLPDGTKNLVNLLTEMIRRREFSPFQFTWTRQDGTVTNEAGKRLEPEEIFRMNYLASNVQGKIPELDELKEGVKEFVRLQGGF